jgi:hypothetical protein
LSLFATAVRSIIERGDLKGRLQEIPKGISQRDTSPSQGTSVYTKETPLLSGNKKKSYKTQFPT